MTTKKVQNRGAARKGEPRALTPAEQRAADELTAGRIRAILSDPKTPSGVAGKLQHLLNKLGEETDAGAYESPDFYAETFRIAAGIVRRGQNAVADYPAAVNAFASASLYAEKHGPREYRVARRCAEIYADWRGRRKGRKYADGAYYFATHVDAVLEGGEDGLIPNPDSKYFTPLFVEAMRERGPRDRKLRALLDLIRRVDAGADLNALYEESERAGRERERARRPPDTRLVDALSEALRDPKRGAGRETILGAVNDLSNETPSFSDLHPEIFPTLTRVLIREARRHARGRSGKARNLRRYLSTLEAVAGG